MNGPFVVSGSRCDRFVWWRFLSRWCGSLELLFRGRTRHRHLLWRDLVLDRPQPAGALCWVARCRIDPFTSLWWHSGLLVFVIGVARRATGLLHLIVNHRHDGVIRDAALTRAIVVENVTEPRPALLHQNSPGAVSFQVGYEGRRSSECSKPRPGCLLPAGGTGRLTASHTADSRPANRGTPRVQREPPRGSSIAASVAHGLMPARWLLVVHLLRTSHSPHAIPAESAR